MASASATATFRSDTAETHRIDGATATFSYRRMGPTGDVPLVMCMRFKGTIDHWDPAFLQVLTDERDVITFDNTGIGSSSGTTPRTIGGMADGALDFVDALGLTTIDLLGWSLGGFVAQAAVLKRPGLVRRLVVAGSGPGRVPGMPPTPEKVLQIMAKPDTDDEDTLYLFFPETTAARAAGRTSLQRLDTRLRTSNAMLSADAAQAQLTAVTTFGAGVWDQLPELSMPVLVANGAHDVMINSVATYAMSQRLPNATILLYSDAGHGFLFQHYSEFGGQVVDFLGRPGATG